MKLYAPKYYKKFKCIADKCEHSCCNGWEIDIDADTLKKYRKMKSGYGAVIKKSISEEGTPHFVLGEGERCPHLDERGLCKIISNLGEDYLCDICREHPRFYNFTRVAEVGIGMSCPEAARIILSSPDFAELEEVGNANAEDDGLEFDGRAEREKIYNILNDKALDYGDALNEIYQRYLIESGEDNEWRERLSALEYLDVEHKALFTKFSSLRPADKSIDEYLKRFLAYLVYRHCTEAFDSEDFCSRLSFCLFCERLLAFLICDLSANTLSRISEIARTVSEEIEYSDDNTLALTY